MYDPDRYRDKAEVEQWKQRDPIDLLVARMRTDGELEDGDLEVLEREVAEELARAIDGAEAGPWEPVEDLTRFVYSERS
jgi:pyruvate dehydrogenase E1 component alpha subunit